MATAFACYVVSYVFGFFHAYALFQKKSRLFPETGYESSLHGIPQKIIRMAIYCLPLDDALFN